MTLAVIDHGSLSVYLLFGSFAAMIAILVYWGHQSKMYDKDHPPVDGRPQANPYKECEPDVIKIAAAVCAVLLMLGAYLSRST